MTITHGVLSYVEGNILYIEVKRINQSDLDKGYTKPFVRIYSKKNPKKKYFPPKDALSRSAPMTGQGRTIYRERWR